VEFKKNQKKFAQKDEIINIQGQFIEKLEEVIVKLNRQLSTNSIAPLRRTKEVENLCSAYRRVSCTAVS